MSVENELCSELLSEEIRSRIEDISQRENLLGRVGAAAEFREKLFRENEVQNLTRLVSPEAFVQGHAVDVIELIRSGWVKEEAFDLGSGCGVPGLLAGIFTGQTWVLCDSEQKKAGFLERVASEMALAQIRVFAGRAEDYLRQGRGPRVIVSRAVGPVERLMSWIGECSTWNTLILFKGPSWDDEWAEFQRSRYRRKLEIAAIHEYSALSGAELRQRKLVRLKRTG